MKLNPDDARWAVGRRGVFCESGTMCVVRVEQVEAGDDGPRAALQLDGPLVCHFREGPPRFTDDEQPFGQRWGVFKVWESFYCRDRSYWDASPYMGWYLFLDESVVARFLNRDLEWTEDYW
jgi:hypothetical protein